MTARTPWAVELESILAALVREHESMLDAVAGHRRAIASADPGALAQSLAIQQSILQNIAELEHRRHVLVRGIIDADPNLRRLDRAGSPPPRISELLTRVAAGARQRLSDLASRLRELAQTLQAEQRRVRLAAETLAAHMQGLMQQIGRKLSPAGTYAPRTAPRGTSLPGALDLTH